MNLTFLKSAGSAATYFVKQHAPEILIGTGIAGTVTASVMACRATLKIDEVKWEHEHEMNKVKKGREQYTEEEYTEKAYRSDVTVVYTQTTLAYAKLYAPAVTLGIVSIASILAGYNILNRRSLTYLAAAKSIQESFMKYRERVIEEHGEEKDFMYRNGIYEEKVKVKNPETGKTKTETVKVMNPEFRSNGAFFFDESSRYWEDNAEYNLLKCRQIQNWANDRLKTHRYVLVNEIREAFDVAPTDEGAITGWVMKPGHDAFIDLGLYDTTNYINSRFVNGLENVALIDLNHDGVIIDEIEEVVMQRKKDRLLWAR